MQVLRAFDFSTDGFTSQHLEPGDDPSGVPGEFVAGLTAEGFLGDGEAATKALAGAPETGEAVALETAENEPQPEAAPEGEPASEECEGGEEGEGEDGGEAKAGRKSKAE
jgi:hypothetical protein